MLRAILVSMMLLICTVQAHANISAELDKVFDDLVTSGSLPNVSGTQRRGVFNGGSFYMRNKILKPNIIKFEPPSFGGLNGPTCSGINFYGGSISFIKKDEIVAFLRSLASNAAGYIFTLALSSACDKCAQWVAFFQKSVEKLNEMMKNSCGFVKMAHAALKSDPEKNPEDTKQDQEMINQKVKQEPTMLSKGDIFAYFEDDDSDDPLSKSVLPTARPQIDINPLWEAIKEQDVAAYFTQNNEDMVNALHMLIGPIVGIFEGTPPVFTIKHVEASIDFKDLYWGTNGASRLSWNCTTGPSEDSSSSDSCLQDHPGNNITLTGMNPYVTRIVMGGTVNGTYSDGILMKFRNNGPALSSAEEEFLKKTRLPVGAFLRAITEKGIVLNQMVEAIIQYVALDLTVAWTYEVINALRKSMAATDVSLKDSILARIEKIRSQIDDEYKNLSFDVQKQKDFYQLFTLVMQSANTEKRSIGAMIHNSAPAADNN